MFGKLMTKSIFGWNKFLTGTHAQRLIASMLIGGICGFTKTAIEVTTGLDKRRKEHEELEKLRMYKWEQETNELLRRGLNEMTEEIHRNIQEAMENQFETERLLEELHERYSED